MSESRPEASSPAEGVGMVRWITKYPAMMNLYEGQRVGTITVQTGVLSKLPGSPQLLPSLFRFRALQHGGTPFRLVREEDGEIRVRCAHRPRAALRAEPQLLAGVRRVVTLPCRRFADAQVGLHAASDQRLRRER